jgi:hypothetical protein
MNAMKEPTMAERRKTSARKGTTRKMSERKTTARKAAPKKTVSKKTVKKTTARKSTAKYATGSTKRWSQHVTETSDAMDLKNGVFKLQDPKKIAASLKSSAEHSARRKTGAYRSALSMLTFYINRAGKNLPKTQLGRLERAKDELKKQFGKV